MPITRFPLYLRIWLAVVAAVALISGVVGWWWQAARDERPAREMIIRSESGEVLGQSRGRPLFVPGEGLEFRVPLDDGSTVYVQLPVRPRPPGGGPPPRPWFRGTTGFFWMLAFTALAVAIGSYPVVRRLTRRLEALHSGVERWGAGDLSARVDESGSDEAAHLARRFNHAAARVEQLVQSQKSLLANASHELRSPLARIRMGLELMNGGGDPRAARSEIARDIAELDQLIDEILLASRLDARDLDLGPTEPVDLTGLAAEESARTGAELLAAAEERPVLVQGIPRLLRRLVRNLLENARRYSDGPVTVEVGQEGGDAVLRVRDQGPGVPPALRERIFEPFYRLPGASERAGGVGLGLALVRSIAQRHGGSVRCDGQPGGGACFSVRLPALASSQPGPPAPAANPGRPGSGGDPAGTRARSTARNRAAAGNPGPA
ncbi:sensor histidine kinase [Ramlibacter aurantiacus]|uniref:sensor histidine kinase n=1 Tax=Ramlibacter aurantiacus TaxID=2801330 RepID=UPI001F18B6BE|nr:ATP-binding protein [Ramlibacter aurantiacus]